MEYSNNLKKFGAGLPAGQVDKIVAGIRPLAEKNRNTEVYKRCFGFIDLTSLNSTDSHERIERFVTKPSNFRIVSPESRASHRYVSTRLSSKRQAWLSATPK